jgi:dTDP-4-amino-4,6-dideoxygalactose transaminase
MRRLRRVVCAASDGLLSAAPLSAFASTLHSSLMTEIAIPFFRPAIGEDDIEAVTTALRSGWLTSAGNVRQFEAELAVAAGARHVNVVNSATAAMHLALAAWGVGPGDEVITTPYTFVSTATVAVHCGARVVFADVREGDFNIDPEQIERAVTPRTKAIIPVHFAGEPCRMDEIMDIARRHGLKVLEDAAHAIGSAYRGRPIGSIGDATAFSFYATKNITTGEGGALATDDEDLSNRVRELTLHGLNRDAWNRYGPGGNWRYDVASFGFKDNMTDFAAALGRSQLRKIDQLREARTRVVQRYFANLGGEERLRLPSFDEANQQAWHLFVVRVQESSAVPRDEVIRQLAARGIQTSVHFIPVHTFSAYQSLGEWKEGDFPVAERCFAGAISLPLFPTMTDAEVDTVSEALLEIVRGG